MLLAVVFMFSFQSAKSLAFINPINFIPANLYMLAVRARSYLHESCIF